IQIIKDLEEYISKVDNPFKINIRISLIKKDNFKNEIKLGTYGVIKGANYYLVAACEDKDFALQTLGYTLEKVILYCTSLGLGTVWLGGSFSRGDFAKAINLKDNEILPIVSPVGYEGGKKSLLASII
ncbi:nitroreductase Nfs, partial [Clostridium perfringens]